MKKLLARILTVLVLIVLTAGGVMLIKPWAASSATPAASGSAKAGAPPDIVADGLTMKPRAAATEVHAVGTLVANESVVIASEIARRVTKIHFEDGAKVKKGDVLIELDGSDLAAKSNELYVRRRLLVDTEVRQKKLLAGGLGTQQDYERAKAELDLLDAQAGSLSVDLDKTKIRAPFDGRLGLRTVSIGALVSPGTVLVTLQDTSKIKVDFTVPERFGPLVKENARFKFTVEGAPKPFEGAVRAVEPRIDAGTRALKVRGVADVADDSLFAGGFVSVDLAISSRSDALFVPSEVIVPSLGGHAVYRFKDGKAETVEVHLGVRSEKEVEVLRGLAPGDVVLVSNLLRLRPGAKVKLGKVAE